MNNHNDCGHYFSFSSELQKYRYPHNSMSSYHDFRSTNHEICLKQAISEGERFVNDKGNDSRTGPIQPFPVSSHQQGAINKQGGDGLYPHHPCISVLKFVFMCVSCRKHSSKRNLPIDVIYHERKA